jgi:hypothetical protein
MVGGNRILSPSRDRFYKMRKGRGRTKIFEFITSALT